MQYGALQYVSLSLVMPTCCVWTADFMTFYVHEVYFMQRLILNVLGLCDIFMHLQFVFHIRLRCFCQGFIFKTVSIN